MKPWRVQYVLAGMALLAAAFLWPREPKDPVYQGKTLTQWINEAYDVGIFEQTAEMNAAMSAFGTNAIPFLLKEFTRPISRLRGRLYAWVNSRPFLKIHLRTDEERVHIAGRGMILLGTNAAAALPVLMRYLNDPVRDAFVMDICYHAGDAAVPSLTAAFASTNPVAISNVVETLRRMAHRSDPARDALATVLEQLP